MAGDSQQTAVRILGLAAPAMLALTLGALAGVWGVGGQWITVHFFRTQDLPAALLLVASFIALRRYLPQIAQSERLAAAIERCRAVPAWAMAAGVFALALAGTWVVFGNYPLSMDEFWAVADGKIIASGAPMARIPVEWREYGLAMQPIFARLLHEYGLLGSAYLPVNAAILALLGPLSGPLLAALSVLLAADLARRLLPEHKSAPLICALLMASSSQLLLTAMTPYAMTAHLAANLAWLWLFLRKEPLAHLGAALVAMLAIGLHQVVFFPLFAAPFLFEAFLARRRVAALAQALAIGAAVLFWGSWGSILLWWFDVTSAQAPGGGGTGQLVALALSLLKDFGPASIGVMGLNMVRWMLWQNWLAVPLVLAVAVPVLRVGGVWRGLLGGIALTIGAVTVLLAFQGHGWGYRYLHGLTGNLCLLATYAWFRLQDGHADRRPMQALFAVTLVLSLAMVPFRSWQAERFSAAFRNADAALSRIDADVVLINAPHHMYAIDLVRNDPFLTNRPLRMTPLVLSDAQLSALCTKYKVAYFGDADAARFGLPRPVGVAEPLKPLPRACPGGAGG